MQIAYGSACCGSAARFPGTVSPNSSQQLNFLFEYNDFIYEHISPEGIWYPNTRGLSIETYRLEYSQWLSEVWQYSITIPFLKRNSFLHSSQGLGDIQLTLGYALSDFSTLLFTQISLPTGLNRFEAEFGPIQSRGRGQWAISMGYQQSLILKNWDFIHSMQLQFIKSQTFLISTSHINIRDNFAHSLLLGIGYHFHQFRFGPQIIHFYQNSSHALINMTSYVGQPESFTSIGLVASWNRTNNETWLLQFYDQTQLGWPQNTNLGWLSSIQAIYNW